MKRACALSIICIAAVSLIMAAFGVSTAVSAAKNVPDSLKLVKISEFSTYYKDSDPNRKHNIALAVKALDGVLIKSGEELSFNRVVGARTAERGYRTAKVILNGEYVSGLGGGVCQVSTTLFNAWALAGLDCKEVHCHTLPSSYVGLSMDAAVSEYKDLTLVNNSVSDVYVSCQADGESIAFAIYGAPNNKKYRLESELVSEIQPKGIDVVTVEYEGDIVKYDIIEGKNGRRSRAYLVEIANGTEIRRQIREDWYQPTNPKVIKYLPRTLAGKSQLTQNN